MISAAGRAIGLDGVAPHDMRRTFAGLLEDSGMDIMDIQKVMRHSSVATTERYLQDNPSKAVDVLRNFSF